ncbi:alginate lyase family protein [Dokdonia pacifica]|uniref:Heparinase II/III N-terminus n=2 Tax=Dokdonia pacifica TaxID=1627892 RepID=A0A238YKY4_9FLAO|nr:alginate lyase family protein [Dokdonia pacifica]SNR71916.1 Heparinase II/III N-terminus [Dokdonia pacifica]
MGIRYVTFRVKYMVSSKLGIHKNKFPISPDSKSFITLASWRANTPLFFFDDKDAIPVDKKQNDVLASRFRESKNGTYTFFSSKKYDLGTAYDWIVNSATGYRYDITKHWSEIEDLSAEAGDIKYVWEKARFSYLYDIIRHDYHNDSNQAAFVFSEIESFINQNPINLGPNYKCSQEISLRILNWTFALYYYKHSTHLTSERFEAILNSIYWQLHHVYNNINFSRIAVRNNHAITETLMLYISGLLFPFIPETKKWSRQGKKWFEQEIDYQIYDDGTFLQFSMNYHRVAVQLLTWGIRLSQLHNDTFTKAVYEKAKKSLDFLEASQDPVSKQLPNYGSNDGALFFKLTDDDYRNYQSQLDDLRAVLSGTVRQSSESQGWYGLQDLKIDPTRKDGIFSFRESGYYIIQEESVKTFIKCGSYKDRPAQADNLHLDIWVNGINYLRDAGSYKYNTSKEELDFFMGTKGHNTISVNGKDQMLKGSRFIWYNWIKNAIGNLSETTNNYVFEGQIEAFKHIGGYNHKRKVDKIKNRLEWNVIDEVTLKKGDFIEQFWHINPDIEDLIEITAVNRDGNPVELLKNTAWYSSYYGVKIPSLQLSFKDTTGKLITTIKIKSSN